MRHISAVLAHVADDREQAVCELRETMPGWLAAGLAAHVPVDGLARLWTAAGQDVTTLDRGGAHPRCRLRAGLRR